MTSPADDGTPHDAADPVGSVGEEAAKLLGALAHWAREQEPTRPAGTDESDALDAATHTLHGLAESVRRIDEHLADGATGGVECRYCPLCRVIHAVRRTSPEVRQHLGTAAAALLEAATTLLADAPWDEERPPDQRR